MACGRRDTDASDVGMNEILDAVFVDIAHKRIEGCFERLVCDIAARPNGFAPQTVPIVTSVKLAESAELSPLAKAVSKRLLKAMHFGSDSKNVGHCEGLFNQCPWSGELMDLVI